MQGFFFYLLEPRVMREFAGNRVVYGLRNLCELYGSTPPEDLDPLKLQAVRRALIERGKPC